ncbi:MAG: diadenylate cyclase [Vulcanimicrobiota bacterium]
MEWLREAQLPEWSDLLDMAVLGFVLYQVLSLMRGTRAVRWMAGVVLLVFSYWLSGLEAVGLQTVHEVLGYVLLYIPLAVIVVFQDTIRHSLTLITRNPLSYFSNKARDRCEWLDQVVGAAAELASEGLGGLYVIERDESLEELDGGVSLDAQVSGPLLVSMLWPNGPLHDGAVVISQGRVRAACVVLPLTEREGISISLGTRHRAALGASEVCDCAVVVISEERGTVSVAIDGELASYAGRGELYDCLASHLWPQEPEWKKPRATLIQRLRDGWPSKVLSAVLAALLWATLGVRHDRVLDLELPLEVRVSDRVLVTSGLADRVRVRVSAPEAVLRNLDRDRMAPIIELPDIEPGRSRISLYPYLTDLPGGAKLVWVRPDHLDLEVEPKRVVSVPLSLEVEGEPAEGYVAGEPVLEPAKIQVEGPASSLRNGRRPTVVAGLVRLEGTEREPVSVRRAPLLEDAPDEWRLVDPYQLVKVRVPVKPVPDDG